MVESVKVFYGVWIPYNGWLRSQDKKNVFADESLDKARQVAKLIGMNAKVFFIDESIVDFENLYLECERRSIWHIFNNWFKSRIAKSSSNK
jgi:hypothetical protein